MVGVPWRAPVYFQSNNFHSTLEVGCRYLGALLLFPPRSWNLQSKGGIPSPSGLSIRQSFNLPITSSSPRPFFIQINNHGNANDNSRRRSLHKNTRVPQVSQKRPVCLFFTGQAVWWHSEFRVSRNPGDAAGGWKQDDRGKAYRGVCGEQSGF